MLPIPTTTSRGAADEHKGIDSIANQISYPKDCGFHRNIWNHLLILHLTPSNPTYK